MLRVIMLSVVAPTHPSRNFFVLCIFMFLWIREEGIEATVNKDFFKENDKKQKLYSPHNGSVSVLMMSAIMLCVITQGVIIIEIYTQIHTHNISFNYNNTLYNDTHHENNA